MFCSFFSNPILNAIPEDSKDDSAIKAEFGTNQNLKNGEDLEEEDLDENDEAFFTSDFEPIIQVWWGSEIQPFEIWKHLKIGFKIVWI